MRIRMITSMAGPHSSAAPGQIIDVDEQTAKALTSGGYAFYVDKPPVFNQPEAAVIQPPETAVKRTYRKRNK